MDESDPKVQRKRTQVLRAADIIPPFDKPPVLTDVAENERPPSEPGHAKDRSSAVGGNNRVESTDPVGEGVPKYDLAENILAEQRRVASRRRRAPGPTPQGAFPVSLEPQREEPSAFELPSEDLSELQRIVAEIVARDIERLCRRPNTN